MTKSIVAEPDGLVVGVDTHAEIHVAVVLSSLGARLGSRVVATTPAGFGELVGWATGLGGSGASVWREQGASAPVR